MTEQQLQAQLEQLTVEDKRLKSENKKVKERNAELLHLVDVYERFIGGQQNG